jgi:hypothetical protein
VAASRTTRRAAGAKVLILVLCCCSCTTVDPGRNPSLAARTFDADYFYCHVEPELIVAKSCGPGDPSKGDSNACHFSSSASAMALLDHPAVDCGGGDHPLHQTQIGAGSAAQTDFEAVSLEMDTNYLAAPVFVRPSGVYHPRRIFDPNDQQVKKLLQTWASK